jgi:catechol 2,3-dioxygenase-like lactoylglutathione lyase family enzyme
MKFDHAEAFVRDRDSAVAWYEKVLGLKEIRRWDRPGPVMVGGPDGMIALFHAHRDGQNNSDDDRQPAIRWRRIAWRVEPGEFEQAQQRLRDSGVAFDGPLEITCYPDR